MEVRKTTELSKEINILGKTPEDLVSEALLLGYDSGLMFNYNNPFKLKTTLWLNYMIGYVFGCKDIKWENA